MVPYGPGGLVGFVWLLKQSWSCLNAIWKCPANAGESRAMKPAPYTRRRACVQQQKPLSPSSKTKQEEEEEEEEEEAEEEDDDEETA